MNVQGKAGLLPDASVGRLAILLAEGGALTSPQPDLLGAIDAAERARIIRASVRRKLKKGETLFRQGDPHAGVAIIEAGRLRAYYTAPAGREMTLAFWGAGNFVGGPELFGSGIYMWSAEAMQPSTVILIPGGVLRELARRVPEAALSIIDALVYKAKCYSALAHMLGTRSMMQRLCQLLLHLADTHGVPHGAGVSIATPLTHAELAALIGATRQWVTTSLARLHEKGAIQQGRGYLVVAKPELLRNPGRAEKRSARQGEEGRALY